MTPVILVDGVDVTSAVIFRDAQFVMMTNGAVGGFRFRVKDTQHNHVFVSGAEVTLDIDGVRKFGGYLTQPGSTFFFDVDDTRNPNTTPRSRLMGGVDYNILFQKRVLYDHADPANINLRSWAAGSRDDVVIKYIFDHYTDLGADGFTYTKVEHIGFPNPDAKGVIGSGGLYFGDAMREINRLISGVWYFNPTKDLVFTDVDTPNASKSFSDNPAGGSEIGYREFQHIATGTKLSNDALIWGAAKGVASLAFARSRDEPSIGVHGLWQYGEFTTQLFRQTSVQARADSIVNGTPQGKRGGKDDQISWTLATFDPSFTVGEKVQIESQVFGYSDVVPIRRMTITFATKNHARFDLLLSHDIDEPWNTYEFWFPGIPPINLPPFPPIEVPPIDLPPAGDCEDCGITEDFEGRTVPDGGTDVGTASSGLVWTPVTITNSPTVEVGGGSLIVHLRGGASITRLGLRLGGQTEGLGGFSHYEYTYAPSTHMLKRRMRFKLLDDPAGSVTDNGISIVWALTNKNKAGNALVLEGPGLVILGVGSRIYVLSAASGHTVIPNDFWIVGVVYTFTVEYTAGEIVAKITDGNHTFTNALAVEPGLVSDGLVLTLEQQTPFQTLDHRIEILDIDIPEINRCTLNRFDNPQDRGTDGGWGNASSGSVWTQTTANNAEASTRHDGAIIDFTGDSPQLVMEAEVASGQWWNNSAFDLIVPWLSTDLVNTSTLRFMFFEPTFGTYRGVDIVPDSGLLSVFNSTNGFAPDAAYSAWTDGDLMWLRFRYEAGWIRARVWRADEDEPDVWLSELEEPSTVAVPKFRVEANGDAADVSIIYSWFDFEWDGKSCHGPCGSLDTFDDREIAEGYLAGWGTPTGHTSDWVQDIAFGNVGLPITGVFDGVGFIGAQGDPSVPTGPFNGGTRMSLFGVPATMDTFTILTEFYPGAGPASRSWMFQFGPVMVFGSRLDPPNGVGNGQVDIYVLDGTTHETFAVGDPQDNLFFVNSNIGGRLKVWWDGETAHVKLWDADLPEPGSWLWEVGKAASIVVDSTVQGCVRARLDSILLKSDQTVALNYADVFFLPALYVNFIEFDCAVPGDGTPVTGPHCENAVRTDSTHYQLSRAMVGGSSRVTVNGPFQRLGIDYTESTAETGTIEFTDPITDATTVVRVCYEVAGSL